MFFQKQIQVPPNGQNTIPLEVMYERKETFFRQIVEQFLFILADDTDFGVHMKVLSRTRMRRTATEEAECLGAEETIDSYITFDAQFNWFEHNGYQDNRRSKEQIACFLLKALEPVTTLADFETFHLRVLSVAHQLQR